MDVPISNITSFLLLNACVLKSVKICEVFMKNHPETGFLFLVTMNLALTPPAPKFNHLMILHMCYKNSSILWYYTCVLKIQVFYDTCSKNSTILWFCTYLLKIVLEQSHSSWVIGLNSFLFLVKVILTLTTPASSSYLICILWCYTCLPKII